MSEFHQMLAGAEPGDLVQGDVAVAVCPVCRRPAAGIAYKAQLRIVYYHDATLNSQPTPHWDWDRATACQVPFPGVGVTAGPGPYTPNRV